MDTLFNCHIMHDTISISVCIYNIIMLDQSQEPVRCFPQAYNSCTHTTHTSSLDSIQCYKFFLFSFLLLLLLASWIRSGAPLTGAIFLAKLLLLLLCAHFILQQLLFVCSEHLGQELSH